MKTINLLLPLMLLGAVACQKSESEDAILNTDVAAFDEQLRRDITNTSATFQITGRNETLECQAPVCQGYIEEYATQMQQDANENCLVLFDCIECCMNNMKVYVTLQVIPENLCASPVQKQYDKE